MQRVTAIALVVGVCLSPVVLQPVYAQSCDGLMNQWWYWYDQYNLAWEKKFECNTNLCYTQWDDKMNRAQDGMESAQNLMYILGC